MLVLQNRYRTRVDFLQRAETQRDQGGLHDVQGSEILGQSSSAYDLEVSEVREIREVPVVTLNVEESGDLLQSAEDLELVGVHRLVAGTESEVRVYVLIALETLVQYRYRALDDCAVLETVDVTGVNLVDAATSLWTGTVARYTLAV